ncbi:hypothetical protein L1987_79349 [Smallanthus sonchifolius]|uniref:Uncharacterized protein n=1 Tax=Smallanthus sonchifolius TaxID=185202 RepID=A0ACB8ZF28_9ASTR|nr:hypothetical protein L1987_79349 [Smallanthus sonchifolius]
MDLPTRISLQKEVKKPTEGKKAEEEAKPAAEDEKKEEESKDLPPPPPRQELVLSVFMHCEGCARDVRQCLKGFDGIEHVVTDCETRKVVVTGEKVDPLKVLERVQKVSRQKVELLSPVPKPPTEKPNKSEQQEPPKQKEKKHGVVISPADDYCGLESTDALRRLCSKDQKRHSDDEGLFTKFISNFVAKYLSNIALFLTNFRVESAVPDLYNSQVEVKGTFPVAELVDHVHKKTRKKVVIMKYDGVS